MANHLNNTDLSILSKAELNVLKSDYVDAFDDALAILEDAQQVKPQNIFND